MLSSGGSNKIVTPVIVFFRVIFIIAPRYRVKSNYFEVSIYIAEQNYLCTRVLSVRPVAYYNLFTYSVIGSSGLGGAAQIDVLVR